MIKAIKISPINTSEHLYFKCASCKKEGTIYLENTVINIDNKGGTTEILDYNCPSCGKLLNTED